MWIVPVWICVGICALGCLQDIDLRGPSGSNGDEQLGDSDSTCDAGERRNPATGDCEDCTVPPDPLLVCPCGYTSAPAPFPYCGVPDATYECDAECTGDITVCNAYEQSDGSVRDCSQLWHCCQSLATDAASQPCCADGQLLICEPTVGLLWDNSFHCRTPTTDCCGLDCTGDADCNLNFQSCLGGSCFPGCDPASHQCVENDVACACKPL